jgi:transcriptional regulator with GAF, ATPase, and Fis domain
MDAIISGRTVFGQQVGEWIQDIDPTVTLHYVSSTRDLQDAVARSMDVHVFVVLADAEAEKRTLAFLSSLEHGQIEPMTVLCPPSHTEEMSTLLPSWLRSEVRPFGSDAIAAVVQTPGQDMALDFLDDTRMTTLHFDSMVGESGAMQAIYRRIEKVAPTECCCLVTGESGTGKELVARAIYQHGARSEGPFVALNSGGIPGELVESELFGHEKGAFTGAVSRKRGLFEIADGGLMLIDEIGELPMEVQPSLLRVLQDGEVMPVGSIRPRRVDVRFVAATNRDLWSEVEAGRFREDLFYRLDVVPLHLPPLRERRGDIPALVLHFAREINAKNGLRIAGITDGCLEALQRFRWPGNVRQLLHVLERMMVLAEGTVLDVDDLPALVCNARDKGVAAVPEVPEDGLDFYAETERFQREILEQVLQRVSWNKNQAANMLRMNRTTLVERLKRLGMTPQPNSDSS